MPEALFAKNQQAQPEAACTEVVGWKLNRLAMKREFFFVLARFDIEDSQAPLR